MRLATTLTGMRSHVGRPEHITSMALSHKVSVLDGAILQYRMGLGSGCFPVERVSWLYSPQMPRLGGHREEAPLLARSCVRDAGYQRSGQLWL